MYSQFTYISSFPVELSSLNTLTAQSSLIESASTTIFFLSQAGVHKVAWGRGGMIQDHLGSFHKKREEKTESGKQKKLFCR